MLALIQEVPEGSTQQGFVPTRLVAHMEWPLEDWPGVNDLLEYKARLNYILPPDKDLAISTGDTAKFGRKAASGEDYETPSDSGVIPPQAQTNFFPTPLLNSASAIVS